MLELLVVGATVRPDPDQARSWLERELSRPEYRAGLVERLLLRLRDLWDALTRSALDASPLSSAAAVVLLVVLVLLVALAVSRVRRDPRATVAGGSAAVDGDLSPEEHRVAARAALDAGDADLALVEAFRAVAARSVRRGLVEERPGLTAQELAGDLRGAVPDHADAVDRAAALFDLVFYGDQPASAGDAQGVLDLDETLDAARPRRHQDAAPPPVTTVPR
jgi:hypothetical protein